MTGQWIKYDGSDEQIAEMRNAENGYILMNKVGHISEIAFNLDTNGLRSGNDRRLMFNCSEVSNYLICSPHPYAAQIQQWSRTGQPVYAKAIGGVGSQECHEYSPPFMHPVEFEYSFTPFGEEV